MKPSTLLALGAALVLALAGCKRSTPPVTKLPSAPTGAESVAQSQQPYTPRQPNLNTPPVNLGTPGVDASPLSANVNPGDLPDPDKLRDRQQDRERFAAQIVYFEFDRANIRADEGSKVDQVVSTFKGLSADHDLLIEGHCDERGTEEYNRSLGERRALALRELLMKSGVDGGRIFTKSLGKDQPANPGHDEAAWSKNRRGEFILVLPRQITTTQTKQ